MSDEWYFTERGRQRGPVSLEELQDHAANGRLRPHDLVWRFGMPQWVPAAKVPEVATAVDDFHTASEVPPPRGRATETPLADDDEAWSRRRVRVRLPERRTSYTRLVVYGLVTGAVMVVGSLGMLGVCIFVLTQSPPRVPVHPPPLAVGGAVDGQRTLFYDLAPGERKHWKIEFRGGEARFWIQGRDHTDVKLRVYDDETQQLVVEHVEGVSDQREVTWRPPHARFYRVEVQNMSVDANGSNDMKMGHN